MNLKKCLSLALIIPLFLPCIAFGSVIVIDASNQNNAASPSKVAPAPEAGAPLPTMAAVAFPAGDPAASPTSEPDFSNPWFVLCDQVSEYYHSVHYQPLSDPLLKDAVRQQRSFIQDAATAKAQMVWVEVPVWKINKKGVKYASKAKVEVLSSIADPVMAIFTEIYQGEEKFPIEYIGAYAWRSNGLGSFHSSGLAIDINPTWNPQYESDFSKVLTGKAWEPGVNPYSISQESDVLKAFGRHGWTWGIDFPRVDLMHFEFRF